MSPEPKPLHHDVALNVFRLLDAAIGQRFKVGMRVNMRMPDDNSMPSPDVFVMEQSRWKFALENNCYPEKSPLLAIEVISPGKRKSRVAQKVSLYLKNGSAAVWVIYPRKREITIHEPGKDARSVGVGGSIRLPEPLPDETVAVSQMLPAT